jgi:hypothetical protein
MRQPKEVIHDVGILITEISAVGVGLRVNYAISLLGEVIRHLSDPELTSAWNFHIWGDLATAASDLNMSTVFDGIPKDNVKAPTEKLKQIAREFEVDQLPGFTVIDPGLQALIDFMNPSWKPKSG